MTGSVIALPRLYRSSQVLSAVGITYRQFDYWCRTGLLNVARGGTQSGDERYVTFDTVLRAAVARRLLDLGISLTRVREHLDTALAAGHLIVGDHVYLTIDRGAILEQLTDALAAGRR